MNVICFVQKEMSWCKYQVDIVNNIKTCKYKSGIHNKLSKLVKPVFMKLRDDELLKKSVYGKSQNTNDLLGLLSVFRDNRNAF